jgi:hypothetical protein
VERIQLDEAASTASLYRTLSTRLAELATANQGVELLVRWVVDGQGPCVTALRRGSLAAEVISQLRREFGERKPSVWSAEIEVEPAARLNEAWYDEDSILGEFLRAVGECEQARTLEGGNVLAIDEYLGKRHSTGILAEVTRLEDEATRARVLRKAAVLGADLLAGEENVA